MKFIPLIEGEIITSDGAEALKEEFKAGRTISKITLGTKHFFFKDHLAVKYIAFSNIYRVFRRVKAINMRMCCANGEMQLNSIVVCSAQAELAEIELPTERAAVGVIEHIQKNFTDITIGV